MSIASAILNLLGLAPEFDQAATIINATKTGVEAVDSLKELLTSESGEKFKKHMIELLGGSKEIDGAVHLDVKPVKPDVPVTYAKGHWRQDFDPIKGYVNVWVPEE